MDKMTPTQKAMMTGLAMSSYATLCVVLAFWISALTLIPLLILPVGSFMAWDFHYRDAHKDYQSKEIEDLRMRNIELVEKINELKAIIADPRPMSK